MRPHRSAEPQEGLILSGWGLPLPFCDYLFVNVKIALIKARVLLQNRIEGSEYVHIFKFAQFPMRQLLSKSCDFCFACFFGACSLSALSCARIEGFFSVLLPCRSLIRLDCVSQVNKEMCSPVLTFASSSATVGAIIVYHTVNHIVVLLGGLLGRFQIVLRLQNSGTSL